MIKPLRLATLAVPLSGNKGSASMLLGLVDGFADAGIDATFDVFSYYPARDKVHAAALPNVTVHPGHPVDLAFGILPGLLWHSLTRTQAPGRWAHHIAAIRKCDAVLLMGGTTFADSMLYKVPWNVLAAIPGYWCGRPTLLLSQTLGPLESHMNRIAARWTFSRAAQVHGRGVTSKDWAKRIGIHSAIAVPDLSFMMRVPSFDSVAQRLEIVQTLEARMQHAARPAIGIAPNAIVLQKAARAGIDYVSLVVDIVRYIEGLGYLPVLIPHSYRADVTKLHNNDRGICEAIVDRLERSSRCFYLDADLDPRDLRAVISRLYLLIASRFHSMVSALATGVPPLTLGWGGHKYLEVLAEFGLEELYAPYASLSASNIRLILDRALRDRDQFAGLIRAELPRVIASAARTPGLILESIR